MNPAVAAGLLLASAGLRAEGPGFAPPAPGTYELQHIFPAPSGSVVDVDSRAKPLAQFTMGRVTLLSLVYTRCSDGAGCPLATYLLGRIRERMKPSWGDRVRLVSLSFDPAHDTPAVMRAYAREHAPESASPVPWDFLTTRSRREIEPILDGFGQDVWTARGSSALPHVLKVFLLDPRGSVREIYTTSFLQPDVVLNDVETLLLEEAAHGARAALR
jgi:cytochrome oxidase Cu insertion factor (SCO1/SenC/PrrC family)